LAGAAESRESGCPALVPKPPASLPAPRSRRGKVGNLFLGCSLGTVRLRSSTVQTPPQRRTPKSWPTAGADGLAKTQHIAGLLDAGMCFSRRRKLITDSLTSFAVALTPLYLFSPKRNFPHETKGRSVWLN